MENEIPNSQARYVDEKTLSAMTGIPVATLQQHRFLRKGLPYAKIGKIVRYDLREVEAFLESHKIRHEK